MSTPSTAHIRHPKMKIIRMATIGLSLDIFCQGLLSELSEEYDVVALSSPDDRLATLGAREKVRTIGVRMHREISPLADLKSVWQLYRAFRREKPRMVHSMTPKAGLLGMMAARLAGVPVRVHTFTGLVFPTSKGLKRLLLKTTDRFTCMCATHVIPEGEGVKADLTDHHITTKPMKVLGHGNVKGVDLGLYTPTAEITERAAEIRKEAGIAPTDKVFVYIGRFVGDKGLRELITAFKALGRPDWHLLLVGDLEGGADDISPEIMAGVPNIHTSQGWVSDVRPWLAAGDIFVFPSYREGFPNVVLEAGAMGLPAIVTDINGSREIITDGKNGLIVPPRDSQKLLEAMVTMTRADKERLSEMGAQARENVESHFSQAYVRGCLKEYYRSILGDDRTIG